MTDSIPAFPPDYVSFLSVVPGRRTFPALGEIDGVGIIPKRIDVGNGVVTLHAAALPDDLSENILIDYLGEQSRRRSLASQTGSDPELQLAFPAERFTKADVRLQMPEGNFSSPSHASAGGSGTEWEISWTWTWAYERPTTLRFVARTEEDEEDLEIELPVINA